MFWGSSTAGICILPQAPDAPFAVVNLELFTHMDGWTEGWGGAMILTSSKFVNFFLDNTFMA